MGKCTIQPNKFAINNGLPEMAAPSLPLFRLFVSLSPRSKYFCFGSSIKWPLFCMPLQFQLKKQFCKDVSCQYFERFFSFLSRWNAVCRLIMTCQGYEVQNLPCVFARISNFHCICVWWGKIVCAFRISSAETSHVIFFSIKWAWWIWKSL